MKKRIILSLSLLFLVFGIGALMSILNIEVTKSLFNGLARSNKVHTLRNDLIQDILKVQVDLYTYNTPLQVDLNNIISNVEHLDEAILQCSSCHHEEAVKQDIDDIKKLISDFKIALSYYITASANKNRTETLKEEAYLIGNELLGKTESLSFSATEKIEAVIGEGSSKLQRASTWIFFVLVFASAFGLFVATRLTRAMTAPIAVMVGATRRISKGELGYRITEEYPGEFGELARHFNAMSASLEDSYSTLEKEVAERKQTEAALRESEERYALAVDAANDGLWDWDLRTRTVFYSPRWKSMLGFDEGEIGGDIEDWFRLVHPEDRGRLEAKIADHLAGHASPLEDEYRIFHRDGSWRWMLVRGMAVKDPAGTPCRMAGSQTDITERKRSEERLVHGAFHDVLTGLPNRALFMDRLQHAIHLSGRRDGFLYGVLFLDLDRFKVLNDSLGHLVGDQILVAVGQKLSGFLRPTDTVARLGGDEFAILLEDVKSNEDMIHIATRIQQELPSPLTIAGNEIFITASIGVAFGSEGYRQPEEILRDADLAMYKAKSRGKARFEIFDISLHADTIRRLELETDLRRAIEGNEFRLHYQPVLCLKKGEISGFEALIRWEHPVRGLVLPSEFIPVAEETGLIVAIGEWVLREACRQVNEWHKRAHRCSPLTVNINLSSREFTQGLVRRLQNIFEDVRFEPDTLRIEITERTIMEDPESASALLLTLKDMGIGLQIDDFGTGYSSLSYLHHFPIDALKIDRSFISNIDNNKEKCEIVKAIVALAHNLDMDVVAEGVERKEELNLLKELGCDYVQGYLISEPMDIDSMIL